MSNDKKYEALVRTRKRYMDATGSTYDQATKRVAELLRENDNKKNR